MANIKTILTILFLCSLNGALSQYACTQYNYNTCVRGLAPYLQGVENTFFPNHSLPLLDEMCNEFDKARPCLQSLESACPNPDKARLRSTQQTFEYICKKNRTGFIKYGQCLASRELHQRGQECNTTFHVNVRREVLGNNCGHLKAFVDCLHSQVRRVCSPEAASWQKGLDDAALQPLLSLANCRLDKNPESYCITQNIQQCTAPLSRFRLGQDLVARFTVAEMTEICRLYRQVRPCMETFLDDCHFSTRAYYQGIHDSYTYICDDHFEEYKQHVSCLSNTDLHHESLVCNASFLFGVNSTLYRTGTSKYRQARLCQHSKTWVDCLENLVYSFCGAEAAAWQRGFDEAVYTPILKIINCTLNPSPFIPTPSTPNPYTTNTTPLNLTSPKPSSGQTSGQASGPVSFPKSWMIAIFIVLALLLLIMIPACLCVCLVKRKKKTAAQQQPQSQGNIPQTVAYDTYQQQVEVGAALPPAFLVPPPYTEKALTFEELANAHAFATPVDEVKAPLPPDYENLGHVTNTPEVMGTGQNGEEDGYLEIGQLPAANSYKADQ